MIFRDTRVLLFGLGLLGGGVATANWLIKQGAVLTITDLKSKRELAPSIKQIKGKAHYTLGGHKKSDIDDADIIVLNPGVAVKHRLIQYALKKKKQVVNEATIFYHRCIKPIVGISGTRGKTTTVYWTAHLMGEAHKAILAGNSPKNPFLQVLSSKLYSRCDWVVTEMPSFQAELFENFEHKPDIAVITNIYQDHFNRYASYRAYVKTKANLFADQGPEQHLILNYDNSWTPYLLTIPHKSKEWFFSLGALPREVDGLMARSGKVYFQHGGASVKVLDLKGFVTAWGMHNVQNLLAAALAAYASGASWSQIQSRIASLPQIPMRQETIYRNKTLTIINDTTATSPEGTIAAVERFGSPTTILITGGTDRKLSFAKWGKIIPSYILSDNIIMLDGSATKKMRRYIKGAVYSTLRECIKAALSKAKKFRSATIVFSPASKSFEKFANEYDRGKQFNALVKKALKK